MLNTGRRKLNSTTTQLSPFTHNDSELFTLISNDVTKPTVHNTSQFRVPQFTQNVALNVDTNNGWKQNKRERRKCLYSPVCFAVKTSSAVSPVFVDPASEECYSKVHSEELYDCKITVSERD